MDDAEIERAAVVDWLKKQAARCLNNKRELREMLSPMDWKGLNGSEMAYRFAALALKRGDHHHMTPPPHPQQGDE